jgi:hypothetical protein
MDMLKYPTLSSLAFAIFRAQFLGDSKIPLLQGKIYDFIKQSYTGGAVDVFQPTSEGKVYRYDVNSLYPYVMKEFPMPSGTPIYFEGDILQYEKNSHFEKRYGKPYGIFEADITAPPNLKIPLLQTKIKTKNGHRTIAPLGN